MSDDKTEKPEEDEDQLTMSFPGGGFSAGGPNTRILFWAVFCLAVILGVAIGTAYIITALKGGAL